MNHQEEYSRLAGVRHEIEAGLILAKQDVERLERQRQQIHDEIGALIGAPPTAEAR